MKIAVIGRGFAGLSAAITLREKGHDVVLVGPKSDSYTASTAAHGASTIKGLHEASQPLFALKLLGHREFPQWIKKIETLSKRRVTKIEGVFERFSDLQEFKTEQDRIYKRRFIGAFAVATELSECNITRSGIETLDDSYWFRNFYPQDFWIQTNEYLEALEESCLALGIPILTESPVMALVENDAQATVSCEPTTTFIFDKVVVAAGAGMAACLGGGSRDESHPVFFAAPGYTAMASNDRKQTQDFCAVKELSAVAHSGPSVYLGSTTEANGIPLVSGLKEINALVPQKSTRELNAQFSKLYKRVLGTEISSEQMAFDFSWGVRVRSRDRIPVVGALSEKKRIFINGGYYKSGVTLTPLGATLLANLIAEEPVDPRLRPMDAERLKRR